MLHCLTSVIVKLSSKFCICLGYQMQLTLQAKTKGTKNKKKSAIFGLRPKEEGYCYLNFERYRKSI